MTPPAPALVRALLVLGLAVASAGCSREEGPAEPPPSVARPVDPPPTPPAPVRDPVWFEERALERGIDFVHAAFEQQTFYIPEIMSGGVGLLDADGDGRMDVFFVQAGDLRERSGRSGGHRLYRNLGGARFEDATAGWLPPRAGGSAYGMGCACADVDNDGDVDVLVTNVGSCTLYQNQGDGRFVDATAASGLVAPDWNVSAAFVDFDADGWLDLCVVTYVRWSPGREQLCLSTVTGQRDYCSPLNFPEPDTANLYRNVGGGRFEDVTRKAGLEAGSGNGLGLVCGDFDADGRVDIYVANDLKENELWLNQGDGRFVNDSFRSGCALDGSGAVESGMGVHAIDLDDNGWLDILVTNLRRQSHTLYLNQAGRFRDGTAAAGLLATTLPYTGFGMGCADFDLDGWLDLYLVHGEVDLNEDRLAQADPYAQENLLLAGGPEGRFRRVEPLGGTDPILLETSRGAAFGDLDDDGDVDVVVVNRNARPSLLINVAPKQGGWIGFRVLNRHGSPAEGALVRARAGTRTWTRLAVTGYSYVSSNDPRVHLGLGPIGALDKVEVRWPDGSSESFGGFPAGSYHELRQGRERASATSPR
jgi:hypothetical protein